MVCYLVIREDIPVCKVNPRPILMQLFLTEKVTLACKSSNQELSPRWRDWFLQKHFIFLIVYTSSRSSGFLKQDNNIITNMSLSRHPDTADTFYEERRYEDEVMKVLVSDGCYTRDVNVMMYCHLFGSDRSSRSHNLRSSVRFGSRLFKAVNLHLSRSESTQRALRRHAEFT